MYKLVMWFEMRMWELYTFASPKNMPSTLGLKKFQGVDRGMYAQYIIVGNAGRNLLGTLRGSQKERQKVKDVWRGLIDQAD